MNFIKKMRIINTIDLFNEFSYQNYTKFPLLFSLFNTDNQTAQKMIFGIHTKQGYISHFQNFA